MAPSWPRDSEGRDCLLATGGGPFSQCFGSRGIEAEWPDFDSASRLSRSCAAMNGAADFNELSESEKRHFYKCTQCREMVDRRQLDDVLFHEDHIHRPDI